MQDPEAEYRIWVPDEPAPGPSAPVPLTGLTLGREQLRVSSNEVSRAARAPVLSVEDGGALRLTVPESTGSRVVVVPGWTFADFQADIPPSTVTWKVHPGVSAERVVSTSTFSLVLSRTLQWDEQSERHVLRALPPVQTVARGASLELVLPATVLVGPVAIELRPTNTGIPTHDQPPPLPSPIVLEVAPLRARLADPAVLAEITSGDGQEPLLIPSHTSWVGPEELGAALEDVLGRGTQGWALVPALDRFFKRRLILAYLDAGGAWKALVSSTDPEQWLKSAVARLGSASLDGPKRASVAPVEPAAPALAKPARLGALATRNARFGAVLARLEKAAGASLGLLLLGESGTGKEFVAEQIHGISPRRDGPFVAVNCGALPESLIESELFGHVSGAFTGAKSARAGAFAAAHGGTLLLDEIGDAPLAVQVSLLRALETGRIKPVGSDAERSVDVRVIGATSRDMDALIETERFRPDLYYRVAHLAVVIPALRERREDVEDLAGLFLSELAPRARLSSEARAALVGYSWPGNVRELKNVVQRAVALSGGAGVIRLEDLGLGAPAVSVDRGVALEALEPEEFPVVVIELATRALAADEVPRLDGPRRGVRALMRAALLYLAATRGVAALTPGLGRQYRRLFAEGWRDADDGRGLTDFMAAVGLNPRSDGDRRRVEGLTARLNRPPSAPTAGA